MDEDSKTTGHFATIFDQEIDQIKNKSVGCVDWYVLKHILFKY